MVESTDHLVNDADRRLAAIIESSDDAILSKDLDGIVQSWNKGAERIFGYAADEIVGRSIRILIPPERQQEEDEILANIRAGKHIRHYESVRVRKDGTPIHVSLTVSPLKADNGEVIGASKIARDITEAKRMEEALQEATRQKDRFLAMLAHELRNPLVPLRNGVELMGSAEEAELKAMMHRQVDHLVRLVEDLMDLNRITMGRIMLRTEVVPVAEVVRTAVEAVAPTLEHKGQVLEIIQGVRSPKVKVDRARLFQVITNLLTNASKYTDEGGHIVVRIHRTDTEVLISVKDNGSGFEEGTIEQAFEMFTQVGGRDKEPNTGLGIGLHVVKKLVQLHGGKIEAFSEGLGRGSEFIVHLAEHAQEDGPEGADQRPGQAAASTSRKRVLIADDNEDAAYTMSRILGKAGHEVFLAYNGIEAVGLAEEHRPDLIIMDIGMPKLNGYEACKRIRSLPGGDAFRILALSGWGQPEDKARSLAAGFDRHLVKPVLPDALRHIVAEA